MALQTTVERVEGRVELEGGWSAFHALTNAVDCAERQMEVQLCGAQPEERMAEVRLSDKRKDHVEGDDHGDDPERPVGAESDCEAVVEELGRQL